MENKDYTSEILGIIRSNASPGVMRNQLEDYHENDLAEVFPDIKRSLWEGHLWNPSYCAVSVSDRSIEQVKQYIREQKPKE